MKASDKIYIRPNAYDGWFEGNKPNDNFVEYIRKDVLLEWLEIAVEYYCEGKKWVFHDVINKIKSL